MSKSPMLPKMSPTAKIEEYVQAFFDAPADQRPESIKPIIELIQANVLRWFKRNGVPQAEVPDAANKFYRNLFDRKIWTFKPYQGSNFWGWLYIVVSREAIDWLRCRADDWEPETVADGQVLRDWAALSAEERHTYEPSPERKLFIKALVREFHKLSANDRDLIRLRDVEGLAFDQIAVVFPSQEPRASAGTIRVRLFRAHRRIREALAADPEVSGYLKTILESEGKHLNEEGKNKKTPGRPSTRRTRATRRIAG